MHPRPFGWPVVLVACVAVAYLGSPAGVAKAERPDASRPPKPEKAAVSQPRPGPPVHPCLTLTKEQIASAVEQGRRLYREGKPIALVHSGWEARKPETGEPRTLEQLLQGPPCSLSAARWLSPAAWARFVGYQAEQAAWDARTVQDKLCTDEQGRSLRFEVTVNFGMAGYWRMPLIMVLRDDKGNRYQSREERCEPASVGRYETVYLPAFATFDADGAPRLTLTTRTLTVEIPELKLQATFDVPESWDGTGSGAKATGSEPGNPSRALAASDSKEGEPQSE